MRIQKRFRSSFSEALQPFNFLMVFLSNHVRIGRANPVWLDPFCRNLELANQANHEDDLPENLSEITDLWNSPARTHVRPAGRPSEQEVACQSVAAFP